MIDKQQATTAPEFSVSDSESRTVRLSDYRGRKNVLLVFNRGFT
jgi:peroxiredoxin